LTPDDVAASAKLSTAQLWHIANHIEACFQPPKPCWIRGKVRTIDRLKKHLKPPFKRIGAFLDANFPTHPAAHGGVKGRSAVTSARLHLGARFIVTRDVRKCFDSITRPMVLDALRGLSFRPDTAKLLSWLFAFPDRLPTGSPLSPRALNLFFKSLDQNVASQSGRKHWKYGRLYDDLLLSGRRTAEAPLCGSLLEQEIERSGLAVSEKKKAKLGLQTSAKVQYVHGLIVNSRRGVRISSKQAQTASALADAYVHGARRVAPLSLAPLAARRLQLHGWICTFRQAEFSPWEHLNRQLETGDRLVNARLRAAGLVPRRGKWWVVSYGPNRTTIHDEPRRLKNAWLRRQASPGRSVCTGPGGTAA
jgi:hypothetical protein